MHCEYVWGVGMNTFTNDKFARSNLRSNFFCAHLFARYAGFYHTTDAERYYKVINAMMWFFEDSHEVFEHVFQFIL